MRVTVFVEGGGQSKDLRTRCREGFHNFLSKAVAHGRSPKIVACGSRSDAFDRFKTAVSQGSSGEYLLLVDSEDVVSAATVWQHVGHRPDDNWECPDGAREEDLHFMAVCMESWLVADAESLSGFYSDHFHAARLPPTDNLETVDKATILQTLRSATRDTTKGEYAKGKVSFAALGALDINTVRKRMPYCERFAARLISDQPENPVDAPT